MFNTLRKIAYWLSDTWWGDVVYWGLTQIGRENINPNYIPIISLLAAIGIIAVALIILHFTVISGFWVKMHSFARKDSTGRLATKWEVFKNYSIPSWFSNYLSAIFAGGIAGVSGIGLVKLFFMEGSVSNTIILVGSGIFVISAYKFISVTAYTEIRKKVKPFPLGRYNLFNVYLTGGERKSIIRGSIKEQRQENMMVIGPTGSGKTSVFFIPPLIEDAFSNCSAVFIEAKVTEKDDMLKIVGPVWHAQGKKVIVFDPWDDYSNSDKTPISFNPLFDLKCDPNDSLTKRKIDELIDAIYRTYEEEKGKGGDAWFSDSEVRLLEGLIYTTLLKKDGQRNFANIHKVVSGTLSDLIRYVKTALPGGSDPKSKEVFNFINEKMGYFITTEKEDSTRVETKANTMTGVATKLRIFSHPNVRKYTLSNELDLSIFFKEPCLLCIKAPTNIIGAGTLASIIIRLIQIGIPNKDKIAKEAGLPDDFKVWFYLDELPSLSLPKLDNFAKTCRSSGAGVIGALQDENDLLQSLTRRGGVDGKEALLASFKHRIYLPGCSFKTMDGISGAIGTMKEKTRILSRQVGSPLNFRAQTMTKDVDVVTGDELKYMDSKSMPKNAALVYPATVRPFFVKILPWYKRPRYKRMVSKYTHKKYLKTYKYYKPDVPLVSFDPFRPNEYRLVDVQKAAKKTDIGEIIDNVSSDNGDEVFAPDDSNLEREAHEIKSNTGGSIEDDPYSMGSIIASGGNDKDDEDNDDKK